MLDALGGWWCWLRDVTLLALFALMGWRWPETVIVP